MSSRISVIIPTRNCAGDLTRLLRSLDRQTVLPEEILVVDNFSDDETPQCAQAHARVTVWQSGPERHRQRVTGAEKARGDYLAFFDADMELDATVLQECLEEVKRGAGAVIIPERGGGTGFWAECQKLEKSCYWRDPWMEAANRFLQRSVYDAVGGYHPAMIAGEDFELHDRLLAAGVKIGRCRAMITHYENTSWTRVLRKKFYYGANFQYALKDGHARAVRRYSAFKPAYGRNLARLLEQPVHAAGLFFMKAAQSIAGLLGYLTGRFRNLGAG
jgi:glycosyltransferase involved in cell wall biosynthesis